MENASPAVPFLRELLRVIHPGQQVKSRSLRLVYGRQRWDRTVAGVRLLESLLHDEEGLAVCILGPELGSDYYRRGDGTLWRRRLERSERETAVVDVNNLVWSLNAGGRRVEPLLGVVQTLRSLGVVQIIGIADANLRYVVSDPEMIGTVAERFSRFTTVEGGTPADGEIIATARGANAFIVSNDRFRDWKRRDRWARANVERLRTGVVAGAGPLELSLPELEEELRAAAPG